MPSGIGNAVALKNLYVRNQSKVNPTTGSEQTLTSLPNEIGNINTLEILDVSSNILATLPSTIGDLDNLEDLTLDNNNLKSLPTTIGALSNLKILQLTGNELTSLPNEIGDLSNLENLSIGQQSKVENNETIRTLTAVPATLTNLAKLTSFSASSNKITGLVDLSGINTLRFISLENNEITDLKLGEVPTGVSTTYRIQQNPFITCVEVPTSQITIWEQRLQRDNGVAISDNCTGFRVPQKERQALIDFYNATGGGDTWEGTNWDNDPTRLTNVGSWAGITTEVVNSQKHVTKINITQFIGITGQITGDIASSIKDLEELTELIISSTNSSLNADIESLPSEIGLLSKLVKINLQRNKLSSLPNEIGDLPLLEELNVQENELTSLPSGIGNAVALKNLYVRNQSKVNPTTGSEQTLTSLPNEIGNINTLEILDVSSNLISELQFNFEKLEKLKTLNLNYNRISGNLDLINQKVITSLNIQYNNINTLKLNVSPTTFGSNVGSFSANRNALGCIEVPTDELVAWQLSEANEANNKIDNGVVYSDNCAAVTNNSIPDTERDALIALYNNTKGDDWRNDLSGSYNGVTWVNDATQKRNVGAWFGVTTAIINGQKHVAKVELNSNLLDGTIPSVIKNLTQLKELEFNSNAISEIPSEIGDLANLEQLTFTNQYHSENQEYVLKSIPTEINNIVSLKRLELSSNQLEGNLDFSNLVNLDNLSVSSNQITGLRIGTSPSVFDNGYDSERQYRRSFDFSNQYLNCVAVPQNTVADWEASSFATSAPSIVWGQDCTLYNNVPEKEIQALVDLYNNLDGANWVNKTNWDGNLARAMINNPFNATKWQGITTKIVNGEKHITDISLSNNGLKGELPESFGDLTKLVNLQLSSNEISGNLPASFGNLTALKAIYLNSNSIEGLPVELGNLSTLETVYLQNNEIFGQLPDLTNNANLAQLFINGNKLQFGDFENEFNSYQNLQAFSYTNQAKVGEEQVIDFGEGYSTTFTAEVSGVNNTYQWYKNFSSITNETNKTLVITNANQQDAGSYYCKVSNTVITNLDIDTETITLNFDAALSTEDNSLINEISLYPNPVSGILQIKISNDISIEEVEVFNTIGKKVRVFHKPKDIINLTSLSKGIYIINMITEKGKVTKRIVKK
ncbi:T9SS type A sorting domain-containing protein [Polaribacter sp. MED152]|uniref:T9SS type A sorting domain-containing protein n=1 Tax=Polaribacter sp. MED152 TaxID=313598 RepID=UPI0002C4E3D9|nr:T9SS type A sorting domain-containing protein [Polaribacter sp. MED152]EAQ40562.3 leucine-rich repeat (LRR) protein [Polaribacter sp. MED152]